MDTYELGRTYDNIVTEYADNEFNNPHMEKHYKKFLGMLDKNSDILVVGCGPGQAAKRFSDHGHYVTGVDLSHKMIEYAEEKVEAADFYCMDVQKMSFKKRFDAVWAASVLIHIPKDRHMQILNKVQTMLQPTGFLFFGMLEGKGDKVIPDEHNKKFNNYVVLMTRDEVEQLLTGAGFELYDYSTEAMKKYGQKVTLSFNYATRV